MHTVILGNGISGITCARHLRKRTDDRITVVSAETDYFFSRTALMYVYMGHLTAEQLKPYEDGFWTKNRIDRVRAWIGRIDPASRELVAADGRRIGYDRLVLATGSVPNRFGWPGQDLPGVQGLYHWQDLEALEANTASRLDRAVIVGGGLIGIELAEMLHTRHIPVTLLVREPSYWSNALPPGESALVTRHIRSRGFDLRLETELDRIEAGPDGRVAAVHTRDGERIPCGLVGLTAGVRPNLSALAGSGIATDRGVLVNRHFETGTEGVYAIGDCAQFRDPPPGRAPVEQVWYTGREHGLTLARTLAGERTAYAPGPWFNSAKFLDLEWHTYGAVPAVPAEGTESLYWEEGERAVRLVWRSADGRFLGINALGIRYRHLVFDRFLAEGRDIRHVLAHLRTANFDPEGFRAFEPAVLEAYHRQTGERVRPAGRKGLRAVMALLGR
jgi:NADPH-dependent 2,4-dienoyl-CoA reductase/sulfur reductase-like enzyme